jgi:hypothetical protein
MIGEIGGGRISSSAQMHEPFRGQRGVKGCSAASYNSSLDRSAAKGQSRQIGGVRDESASPLIAAELARRSNNGRARKRYGPQHVPLAARVTI